MKFSELNDGDYFKIGSEDKGVLRKVSAYPKNNAITETREVITVPINMSVYPLVPAEQLLPINVLTIGSREFLCIAMRTLIPIEDITYIHTDTNENMTYIYQLGVEDRPTILKEEFKDYFDKFLISRVQQGEQ